MSLGKQQHAERGEETVRVPVSAACTAYDELDSLIEETDDPDGQNADMTPLARARRHIERLPADATRRDVLDVIDAVGDATGAETSPIDPLTDAQFRARDQLGRALQQRGDGE